MKKMICDICKQNYKKTNDSTTETTTIKTKIGANEYSLNIFTRLSKEVKFLGSQTILQTWSLDVCHGCMLKLMRHIIKDDIKSKKERT